MRRVRGCPADQAAEHGRVLGTALASFAQGSTGVDDHADWNPSSMDGQAYSTGYVYRDFDRGPESRVHLREQVPVQVRFLGGDDGGFPVGPVDEVDVSRLAWDHDRRDAQRRHVAHEQLPHLSTTTHRLFAHGSPAGNVAEGKMQDDKVTAAGLPCTGRCTCSAVRLLGTGAREWTELANRFWARRHEGRVQSIMASMHPPRQLSIVTEQIGSAGAGADAGMGRASTVSGGSGSTGLGLGWVRFGVRQHLIGVSREEAGAGAWQHRVALHGDLPHPAHRGPAPPSVIHTSGP